jgi:NAD(P)-dependent dehydrogenase (short-subunit alcohol dehydrogenase family)
LITGATAGLGRATAMLLSQLGADLVLISRNARRLRRVEEDVRRVSSGARVLGFVADLSSQREVRLLASRVLDAVPRLHVLINNAAVVTPERRESVDGLELQFAVNYLAPFLLTNLLLPRLLACAPSRVVSVASQVEREGDIDFDDMQGLHSYDRWRAYRQTKLANILFTRELARRVGARGITPISVHPGVYTTHLLDNLMGWSGLVTRLRGRALPGPDVGAVVLARAAAAPDLDGRPGVHLHEHELADPSVRAQDPALARRLWSESERLTGLARPPAPAPTPSTRARSRLLGGAV